MSNWRANNDPLADFIHMLYADDDDDLSENSEFEPDDDIVRGPRHLFEVLLVMSEVHRTASGSVCLVSFWLDVGRRRMSSGMPGRLLPKCRRLSPLSSLLPGV
ncbi:unnamed protein product [Parnassius apollo]|uniref:(apollo) hypothetical protein n=1 Tax=Parnassius apollo TaxID=110799 RepID=A0A8S3W692_PARAO|nr:unnamed protein product [Parnassius apollo]